MIIRRRPNRSESREKSPGPNSPIASATIAMAKPAKAASLELLLARGHREKAKLPASRSASRQATGVRKPTSSDTPPRTAKQLPTEVLNPTRSSPRKWLRPAKIRADPVLARNSSNPTPGPPPKNLEYSLGNLTPLNSGGASRSSIEG